MWEKRSGNMRNTLTIAALGVGLALSGCGGGGDDEDEQLIGADRSYTEALDIGEAQWLEVIDIANAEGGTPWPDMPQSGSATYVGVITGWADGGPAIDYVADLELTADFSGNTIGGTIENVVTNGVTGFDHPDGQIDLSGPILPDSVNEGSLLLTGSGDLSTAAAAARVTVEGEGFFVGTDARAMEGGHLTDFVWSRGTFAGTTSFSDGVFSAIEQD